MRRSPRLLHPCANGDAGHAVPHSQERAPFLLKKDMLVVAYVDDILVAGKKEGVNDSFTKMGAVMKLLSEDRTSMRRSL